MKYPIGIQTFQKIREGGYVYIDKTELVYKLVTTGNIYFLCRPRRFGKSLLISTLKAYYEGKKELFEGLAIEQLEKDWHKYPIFHIDFNGKFVDAGELEKLIEGHIGTWERKYGSDPLLTTTNARFTELLRRAYVQTGRRAVVLIDEYDKPILDVMDTPFKTKNAQGEVITLEDNNRETLKGLYSTFKGADEYLQFVLLTGVTKFSQVSVFSGFNQPTDISMNPKFDALCGITQEELEHYFNESIIEMAEKFKCSSGEMKQRLKAQYDGYHFSEGMTDMYNPFSLLNAFYSLQLKDFWFASGTPTYLVRLLAHNNEQINELIGKWYDADMFANYKADVEKPLPMIYQSGYLTIKDYDSFINSYLLDFPNNEVRRGFLSILASNYLRPTRGEVSSWVGDAVHKLLDGQTDEFRQSLTAFLASIPYDSHASLKTDELMEKHFQYTFYLLLRLIGVYCTYVEKPLSQGRVDCIIETLNYVYIFEFKLDGTSDEAIKQIKDKGYDTPYLNDKRTVKKIGVVFSSKTRTVSDWAEE